MKLYEIAQEYRTLLDELYDDEGNINNEVLVKLDQNEIAMEKKAIAVASYIKNMEAERKAIDEAKQAMALREKRFKTKIENLQDYLLINMIKRNINAIACPYFDIKLRKCPPSVNIYDEDAIPDEYKRIKTEILPDKIKMKEEMLLGVVIPGANIANNMRVDIK